MEGGDDPPIQPAISMPYNNVIRSGGTIMLQMTAAADERHDGAV
jgi:hypothetical protein